MGSDAPVVRFLEASKHFGKLVALDRLTLEVGEGEIVGLLGPNGAGKALLVEEGTLSELRHLHANTVEATYTGDPPRLDGVAGVEDVHVGDGLIRLQVSGSTDPLLEALTAAHVPFIQVREPSLEELFHAFYDEPDDVRTGVAG